MKTILKVLGIAVGVVVALFVIVAVIVSMTFDPNDYKDDITAAVERATGRQLALEGDLSLALFPTIRIAVGSAAISQYRMDAMHNVATVAREIRTMQRLLDRKG